LDAPARVLSFKEDTEVVNLLKIHIKVKSELACLHLILCQQYLGAVSVMVIPALLRRPVVVVVVFNHKHRLMI
jgi:hypothetical protein